jgi:SAM-dependent methyltransferase
MQQHTYAVLAREEERHWWFCGRRRILESFVAAIARRSPAQDTLRILDVGCGTGGNMTMLERFGTVDGVDASEEAVAHCRARGVTRITQARAECLPHRDGTYDLVTALDVVEHLDDDVTALREIHRVLRAGGTALVFVPAFMWLWGPQDDVSEHRRRYTRPEIVERLRQAGFEVERATYANLTFFLPILAGRILMRIAQVRPATENDLTPSRLNRPFGWIFGTERFWLSRANLPLGVSVICVARRPLAGARGPVPESETAAVVNFRIL